DDVVHVPHRTSLVPGYEGVCRAAIAAGAFGATLSGSGSSIMAVATREVAERVAAAMRSAWQELGTFAETFQSAEHVEGFRVTRHERAPEAA
ncbi:MAG: hypothetical protein H0V09_10630, partial [Gemmatimonadetes bacterium]|nr:hypothetical protein [Gemmatimonadota bacterium]